MFVGVRHVETAAIATDVAHVAPLFRLIHRLANNPLHVRNRGNGT